jgi:glutamyl-tRNA synthetase
VKLDNFSADYIRAALATCQGKVNTFDELAAYCGFYFTDNIIFSAEGVAKNFTLENTPQLRAVREAFVGIDNFSAGEIEAAMKTTAKELGVKVGAIVHPTRFAVTGSNAGPSLYHLFEVLGKEKVLTRIDHALATF